MCWKRVSSIYVRKENLMKIWFDRCFYTWSCQVFLREMYGDKVNMLYIDDEAIFTCRQSLAWTIQHIFSNSHQNCSETVSVDKIMGNKTNVMIGQRISRSRKSRQKQDFSPLYRNTVLFSMRGNLKTRLPCITKFRPLLCSWLQAVVRESPQGTKCTTFTLQFFSGYFFHYSKQSKHVFSLWITSNLYQQHMQMNELCAV